MNHLMKTIGVQKKQQAAEDITLGDTMQMKQSGS